MCGTTKLNLYYGKEVAGLRRRKENPQTVQEKCIPMKRKAACTCACTCVQVCIHASTQGTGLDTSSEQSPSGIPSLQHVQVLHQRRQAHQSEALGRSAA